MISLTFDREQTNLSTNTHKTFTQRDKLYGLVKSTNSKTNSDDILLCIRVTQLKIIRRGTAQYYFAQRQHS